MFKIPNENPETSKIVRPVVHLRTDEPTYFLVVTEGGMSVAKWEVIFDDACNDVTHTGLHVVHEGKVYPATIHVDHHDDGKATVTASTPVTERTGRPQRRNIATWTATVER